jgi:hypothetical protein
LSIISKAVYALLVVRVQPFALVEQSTKQNRGGISCDSITYCYVALVARAL